MPHAKRPLSGSALSTYRRCLDLMKREAHRPLLALVAPAGYGKTALLRQWADSIPAGSPVVLLRLDNADNEPERLYARLLAALLASMADSQKAKFGKPTRDLPGAIAEAIQAADGLHLILDRYEAIREPSIHETFEALIAHAGPNARFCIASREELPFYPNLRSLYPGPFVLMQEHLKLNPEETMQFVRKATRRQLEFPDLNRLDRLAMGWPLALEHFAALLDDSRAEVFSDQAAIEALPAKMFPYLQSHIFLRQTEELQRFMLLTSLPDSFDRELARSLSADPLADSHIESLLRQNVFLSQDNTGLCRYHPLVGFFLRMRLNQTTTASDIAALHERISQWSERNGSLVESVRHALLMPDYNRASGLMLADIAATASCPLPELIRLMEQFPVAELIRHHSIALLYAWTLTAEHRIAAAETLLNQVEPHLTEEAAFVTTGENLRGYFATIRSRIHLMRRDSERGLALMHEAASLLNGPGYLYTHVNLLDSNASSLLRNNAGYWGAIDQSIEIYGYAEPVWSGVNQGLGIIQVLLGECYAERNQTGRAEELLLSGRRIGLDLQDPSILLPGSVALIQLKRSRGEHQAAQILLDETRRLVAGKLGERGLAVLDACQAQLHIKTNEAEQVERWLRKQSFDMHTVLEIGRLYEYMTILRSCLFLGRYRQGLAFGERLLHFAESWYLYCYIAEVNLLLALLYEGNEEKDSSLIRLQQAMELGRKEGYFRLFLNDWEPVEPLLRLLEKQLQLRKSSSDLDAVTHFKELARLHGEQELFANKERFAERKLTAKEYKVLQGLIAGKSNAVVAEELSIRIETVKTHCKSIYRKLGLKSRKAVLRMFGTTNEG